jgi:hypothetical protein
MQEFRRWCVDRPFTMSVLGDERGDDGHPIPPMVAMLLRWLESLPLRWGLFRDAEKPSNYRM